MSKSLAFFLWFLMTVTEDTGGARQRMRPRTEGGEVCSSAALTFSGKIGYIGTATSRKLTDLWRFAAPFSFFLVF